MSIEMKMWRIDGEVPQPLATSSLPAERDLHEFLKRDPSLLGERLLVIGSETPTPFGGRLDLLAIDEDGNLHVLELKRDKTPREVVAQVLDYGSWATGLSREAVIAMANNHLSQPFEAAFEEVFRKTPPDELNGKLHLTIVAAELDASSERIINYLRTFQVPINAVFFSYLEDGGRRYLARSWLTASAEDALPTSTARGSKRANWNGRDWYVNCGGDRPWEDARQFNFISAGGGKWYSETIRKLPEGSRVWVYVPGSGYVAAGNTLAPAQRFEQAEVKVGEEWVLLANQALHGTYQHRINPVDDDAEWVVPVKWLDTRPEAEALKEKGLFANQASVCRLSQEFTLERLNAFFNIDDQD